MSKIKVHVINVSKSYIRYKSEFYRFLSWFGIKTAYIDKSDVLNSINFSINQGEAVGLVGENGAGKSTLLKIITGTVQPTSGNVAVNGRVSAILELGLGFNPEMTGKQNVYLSAGVMGFKETEIDGLIKDIYDFSELGKYFSQPVRTYSSGMQMRLAFSVATAVRPDLLIIDEALAVGDTYFQHKSFNRIKQFREQGTTLLFVSHDRGAVQALCDRAILLEKGCMIKDGKPEEVMNYYNALLAQKQEQTIVEMVTGDRVATTSGTGEVVFEEIKLLNAAGEEIEIVKVGESVQLHFKVRVNEDVDALVLGCGITDRLGQMMFGTNTWHTKQVVNDVRKGDVYNYHVFFDANLGVGSYAVHCSLVQDETHINKNFEWRDGTLTFSVINADKTIFAGSMWNEMHFDIKQQNKDTLLDQSKYLCHSGEQDEQRA